jgi:NAD(P)-dependent dehydrogenase (short-subunit alcohol dehydrogenase family)
MNNLVCSVTVGNSSPCRIEEQLPQGRHWPHIDTRNEITMQDKAVALVTGANQGIGLQIAKDLVAHGFTVLVGSRNLERGEAAAKEVGSDARAIQLVVTDENSIIAAAKRIRTELGRLDVLELVTSMLPPA